MARKRLELFKIQEFDEVRKDFFEKFEVYAVSEIGCHLHRQHVYGVRMNDLPRFPQVLEIMEELVEADIVAAVVTVSP